MAASAKSKDDPIDKLDRHQPPNLKTWVLKASVHCEGCKKKVKKIIHSIPGVSESDVDLKLQKVTVKGNIDVNALIAKLIKKTGKHAELWPEIKTEQLPLKKQSKPKPKPKPPVGADEAKINENEVTNEEKPKTETSVEQSANQDSQNKQNVKSPAVKTPDAAPVGASAGVSEERNEERKPNPTPCKKTEAAVVESELSKEEQNAAVDSGAVGEAENGAVRKKKKRQGQNRKQKSEEREGKDDSSDVTATDDHSFRYYTPNQSPTRSYPAHMYGAAPPYHAPPVYTVNYNTASYPTASYGASYYAMPPQHSEAYAYSGSSDQSQPSDYTSLQSQSSDTFQIFSDENPNACSLM